MTFTKLLLALLTALTLTACSATKPRHFTIEYDEEVKLHNGDMIWVHITRHYERLKGIKAYVPGEPEEVLAREVEISWDTGFEGVGRKNLNFKQHISLIDKVDNKWYVMGFTPLCQSPCIKDSYIKLNNVGSMAVIESNGAYSNSASRVDLPSSVEHNLLSPEALKGEAAPFFLNNKKLTWSEKLELRKQASKPLRVFGEKIYRGE